MTITHQAGDHVRADELSVVSGDDRVTIEVAPDETVRVVYRGEDTGAVLGEWSGPEA